MKFNLSVVNIRLVLDDDAQENWQAVLSELGLVLAEHNMD